MSGWTSTKLGELISITRGTTYKSLLLDQPGPVLLGLASIQRDGGFRGDKLRTYGGESPEKLLVRPGQLYASLKDVTQSGDLLGSVARVPKPGPVGRLSQDTVRLDFISDKVLPDFLYLALLGPRYRAWCRQHATGTTNLGLPRDDFLAFEVVHPADKAGQHNVASVLNAIDGLIENNRRRVEVLEEMARAIYGEWFVKFRYPGHEDVPLVDSALGPIPEGWEVSTLAAIADFTMGQSPKSEFYNDEGIGRPFHQGVADFGRHFPTTRKWCSVEGRSAVTGDVLISVRAPVGRINVADTDITIGRGLAAVRAKDGRQGLLLGHLREAFAVEDSMGNDGAIFKSLGKAEFASIPVVIPPGDVAESCNKILGENFGMIRTLSHSTQRLTALRDLLLPKLVTGQIDVSTLDLDALVSTGSTTGGVLA